MKIYFYLGICLCVCVGCVYICECSAHGEQKRTFDPVELELQVVVSHPMWVLGTRLGSSSRAVCALKH